MRIVTVAVAIENPLSEKVMERVHTV